MRDVNPATVERQLMELSVALDTAQVDLAALDEAAVRAKQSYEVAFARALLTAQGSNADSRKAAATLAVESQALDADIAAAKVRAAKEKVGVLRTRIDVGRTIASSLRTSYEMAGRGAA